MSVTRYIVGLVVLGLLMSQSAHGELVAHWRLNEGSGDVFADTAGGFDGFLPKEGDRDDGLVPTIEWANDGPIPGILETSVLFTGMEGPSFIETPFVGIGGANPRTIAAWVKAPPQTTNTAIVAYGPNRTGEKWHFRIDSGAGGTRIRTEFSGGQNFGGDSVAVEEDVWHHLVSVFPEGGTEGDDIIHYVDGVVEPKLGGTSLPINTGIDPDDDAFPVHIGYAIPHAGRYFFGQMADIRIYDEGLDQVAIQDIMAGAGFLPPGATLGDFNEDGTVDMLDFQIIADNFNKQFTVEDNSFFMGDFDSNLRIDMKDFLGFRKLIESQGGAAAVPEPNCLWLVTLPCLLWAGRFRLGRRTQ